MSQVATETLRASRRSAGSSAPTRRPIYFVSATAFNLLGMDRWVRDFRYVNYYDSFDGHHPHVFVPAERPARAFDSIEEIGNYLLGPQGGASTCVRAAGGGKAVFLMFDEETEQLAGELGLEVAFPPAALRHRLDSKIETTRIGDEAGVPACPTCSAGRRRTTSCGRWRRGPGWATDLVVQTPYGDSGQTTFFIASQARLGRARRRDGRRGAQGDARINAARGRDRGRRSPATARWSAR